MEDFTLIIMEKDLNTGILEKELGMYKIMENMELIVNAYAARHDDGNLYLHLLLKADKELSDEEFENCYDYYESERFKGLCLSVSEVEDCFYPTWDFSCLFDEDRAESHINEIIRLHNEELCEVYALIYNPQNETEEQE